MPANNPEEVGQLFQQYMRDGDIDSVLTLYDFRSSLSKSGTRSTEGHHCPEAGAGSFCGDKGRL